MKFNPDEYETVKERKARFYKDHEDGRIVVKLMNKDVEEKALFTACIYLNAEDQEKKLPRGTGHALEIRDKELSIAKNGKEYESVNFGSWTENAEESAVGRALDNAGYSGNKKASREEMEKAQRMGRTLRKSASSKASTNQQQKEDTTIVSDDQPGPKLCEKHNVEMKPKNGQYGWFHSHARQDSNGNWEYCNDGKGYPSEQKKYEEHGPH